MNTLICLCEAMPGEEHSIYCPFPCYDKDHMIWQRWKVLRDKSILKHAYVIESSYYAYEEEELPPERRP